jgi:hypothetical protein
VCCFSQGCAITLEAECQENGGYWHPEWTTCDLNPCVIYPTAREAPVREASWGRIKQMYR